MSQAIENTYAQEYFEYLKNRGFFRKTVRKIYLRDIQKYCIGKTIDFGCGTGQLLSMLPMGSVGYEVNKVAVNYCLSKGLHVEYYDPEIDNYEFKMIPENKYVSFTMNHVLEHTENTHEIIKKIFLSCYRLGIERIVFTVPGVKGYQSDKTHRTFVDLNFFKRSGLLQQAPYQLKRSKYFPFDFPHVSKFFTHNELRLIFDKVHA